MTDKGAEFKVRLTPKSAHNRIDGVVIFDGAWVLKARVRAVPEDGKANAALEELIAEALCVPRRSVQVVAGHTSRMKTVFVSGAPAELARTLEKVSALPVKGQS